MIAEKSNLDKTKKEAEDKAIQVENERDRKIRTIGNYVHESVPESQTEVGNRAVHQIKPVELTSGIMIG